MGAERAVEYGKVGDAFQGAKVNKLTAPLPGIVGPVRDKRGEISNPVYLLPWQEHPGQFLQVQPPVRRVFEAAVVKVEPVHVHIGLDLHWGNKNGQSADCPRLRQRSDGGSS